MSVGRNIDDQAESDITGSAFAGSKLGQLGVATGVTVDLADMAAHQTEYGIGIDRRDRSNTVPVSSRFIVGVNTRAI